MPPADLPDFHPMTVIRDWNNGEAFRIVNATSGVIAFGATPGVLEIQGAVMPANCHGPKPD